MNIISLDFLLFTALGLIVYYIVPHKLQWKVLLLLSAVFFLLASGWKMLPYLLWGILISYAGTRWIEKVESPKKKRAIVTGTIVLIAGELFLLKDFNLFITTGNLIKDLFRLDGRLDPVSLLTPIGISYYSLSIIGYVLDVYWGSQPAEKNVFKHSLFVCYFPPLVSGPITRYSEMKTVLFENHRFSFDTLISGLWRILWGLLQKMVIADRLSTFISTIFINYETYNGFYLVFGVLCYALRIYTDFSGCMDIMLGVSELFGISLPENFRAPFFSKNISEFWRRWHISLGEWSKDYMLYPILKSNLFQSIGSKCKKALGKKKGKNIPTYLGLFIIWIVIGAWHSGSYQWIFAAGIMPWFYLVSGEILRPYFLKFGDIMHIRTNCFSYRLFQSVKVLFAMCVAWIFACSLSLKNGFAVFASIFHWNPEILFNGSLLRLGLSGMEFVLIFVFLILMIIIDYMRYHDISIRQKIAEQNLAFQWAISLMGIFALMIFGIYGPSYDPIAFIYGAF